MGLLIDTSVLIKIERADESIDDFIASLGGEDSSLSAITASELLVGVVRAAPPERRAQREAFVAYALERFQVLPVDLIVARAHAPLVAQFKGRGSEIGAHDLLIAATALAHGFAMLTYNVREFSQIPGLELRTQAI